MKRFLNQHLLPKSWIDYLFIFLVVYICVSIILPSLGGILFSYDDAPPQFYEQIVQGVLFYIHPFVPVNVGIGAFVYYVYLPILIVVSIVIFSFLIRLVTKNVRPFSILAISTVLLLLFGLLTQVDSYLFANWYEQDRQEKNKLGQQMNMYIQSCNSTLNENEDEALSCHFEIDNLPSLSDKNLVEVYFNSDDIQSEGVGLTMVNVPIEVGDNNIGVGNFIISGTDRYSVDSLYISFFTVHSGFDSYDSRNIRLDLPGNGH